MFGGAGDGDDAPVVQSVVVGAQQDQVVQFGLAAVFPVGEMVGVQASGGPASRDSTTPVAVFQCAA